MDGFCGLNNQAKAEDLLGQHTVKFSVKMRIVNPLALQPQVFFAILTGENQFKPFLYNPIGEIYNKQLQLTGLGWANFQIRSTRFR